MRVLAAISAIAMLAACVSSNTTDPKVLASGMRESVDQFSGKREVRGPNQGVLGAPEYIRAEISSTGSVAYAMVSEQTSLDGWLFLDTAYVLGDNRPRRLNIISRNSNCIPGHGCFPKELVAVTLSQSDIKRGLESGIKVSLRGNTSERIVSFNREYVNALVARVSQ